MKYIKRSNVIRTVNTPQGQIELTTEDLISFVARNGDIMNTGTNVITAEKIMGICLKVKMDNKHFIAIEDNDYNILCKDLETMKWKELAGDGFVFMFINDIKNIKKAEDEEPEVEGEFKLIKPDVQKVEIN